MSGHVLVVAHMEKIDRYGRSLCRVSTFVRRCASQSTMGEVKVTARDGTIGVFENFRFCDRAMARNAVGARL